MRGTGATASADYYINAYNNNNIVVCGDGDCGDCWGLGVKLLIRRPRS